MSNPSAPEIPEKGVWIPIDFPVGFKVSYEVDRVFDRKLELDEKPPSGEKTR